MGRKNLLLFSCVAFLLAFSLGGCGKNKVVESKTYSANEITAVQVNSDTWKVNIMVSTNESVRVSLDGSIADKDTAPTIVEENGNLTVVQKNNGEGIQDQIALGKKGQITLYIPLEHTVPITVNNGIGDIEVDGISATGFSLANTAGYVFFSDITTDNLQVISESGDITVKNGIIEKAEIATSSGYVELNTLNFDSAKLVTKSGEVNMFSINPNTDISIQTGSGDINLGLSDCPC